MSTNTFIIPKDKFESHGCGRQELAKTFTQAKDWYDDACSLCCMWKRQSDCKTCPIRQTFLVRAKSGNYKMKEADWHYIAMDEAAE